MVTTRHRQQQQPPDVVDTTGNVVRRSGRERKPPQPIILLHQPSIQEIVKKNNHPFKNGKKKASTSSTSTGWVQIRKEQVKKLQNDRQQRRKTIPNILTDPYSGETVWIATATLQDIALANKRNKPPWPLSHRFLVTVPSIQQRQIIYQRAAVALSDIEERILPSYGGRLKWECIVTIKEATAPSGSNNKSQTLKNTKKSSVSSSSSPYFCWNRHGELELAAWPYMMEKTPNPPHFPGYYKNGSGTSQRTKQKNNKAETKGKCSTNVDEDKSVEQHQDIVQIATNNVTGNLNEDEMNDNDFKASAIDTIETTDEKLLVVNVETEHLHHELDDEVNDGTDEESDEEEEEEEEELSDDMRKVRELQERAVTGLAELAYNERWRIPIPTIQYKWISPLQQTFYTRKSAWEHAVQLCKNDVLLDKVLHGCGANGKLIKPQLQTQSTTFSAGKLRFIRDGLWIVGQDEQWIRERQLKDEECAESEGENLTNPTKMHATIDSNIASLKCDTIKDYVVPPQQRPWTGLSLFLYKNRTLHQQKRLHELQHEAKQSKLNIVSPSPSPAAVSKNTDTDSSLSSVSSSSNVEPFSPIGSPATISSPIVETTPPGTPDASIIAIAKPSLSLDMISAKFTLVDATKELRLVWKEMTNEDKNKWNNDAKNLNDVNNLQLDSGAQKSDAKTKDASILVQAPVTKYSDGKKKSTSTFDRSKKWCLNKDQIKLCYDAGMEHYDQIMRTVTARDLFRELQDGFDLLRERGTGRWDMSIPEFDAPTYSFLNDTKNAPWMPIVREILGKDVVLIHKGIFLSMPGSSKQVYHQDGPHLTTQYQKPCHAINVFVPLIDLTLDNGPTEFCLGSHTLGYEELDENFVSIPLVRAGTPIIFDYRLGHRGLGNSSTTCRPIVYCTYAASADGKEFRDSVNFSRKRYHRIGDLVEKGLTRAERAEKRQRN